MDFVLPLVWLSIVEGLGVPRSLVACFQTADSGRCSQLVKVLMNLDDGRGVMVASIEMILQVYGTFLLAVSDLRLFA